MDELDRLLTVDPSLDGVANTEPEQADEQVADPTASTVVVVEGEAHRLGFGGGSVRLDAELEIRRAVGIGVGVERRVGLCHRGWGRGWGGWC